MEVKLRKIPRNRAKGEVAVDKLAIIHVGSSKIDLIMLRCMGNGNFTVFEDMSEPVKIVCDFDGESMLHITESNESLAILKMYKTVCEVNKVTEIICVGSTSLKNLKNYKSFLDEIYESCGFKVRILTQEEELKALYTGVINSLDVPKGVVVNISGGATRLVYYNRRNILNEAIIPFGTYYIAKILDQNKDVPSACEEMKKTFKKELSKITWLKDVEPEFSFVGVGNAFLDAGVVSRKIRKYPLDLSHGYVMTKSQLGDVYNLIKTLEIDKTKKVRGILDDRADIFASGVCMIKALFEVGPCGKVVLSTKGLKEGLMYNAIVPSTNEKPISDLLGFSLNNINIFHPNTYSNTRQVMNLSLILFRQLKVLHKLPRGYVKILRIASALHDCGMRVNFYNHKRNSFSVIINSEIMGVSHRDIVLAAFVNSTQSIGNFKLAQWIKYQDLFEEGDLDAVKKLSLIVRLAEALDKTHRNVVEDINCDILGDSVIMKTIDNVDASMEIREALKTGQDFRRIYKKTLEVL